MTETPCGALTVDVTTQWEVGSSPAVAGNEVESLVLHALRAEGQEGPWEVAFRFVSDDVMATYHGSFLGDATPTDILTFASDDEPGGDVMISVDTSWRNAQEEGWPLREELCFLVLHGVLHIVGWDDASDEDRAAMLDRQRVLLATWGRPG